jgi:hypothetical protein
MFWLHYITQAVMIFVLLRLVAGRTEMVQNLWYYFLSYTMYLQSVLVGAATPAVDPAIDT